MIRELLTNKSAPEKAQIKGREIAKLNHKGKFLRGEVEVEITDLKEIDGGIEVLARAWKNGKRLGFGKDGSVDIERFRIFNPPVLVDDLNGDIIREWIDTETGELKQRKLKEDPQEAIRQVIIHNVSIVGKDNGKVVAGKIGNTTSTFYPAAGANSPVDGYNQNEPGENTWATIHDATAGTAVSVVATKIFIVIQPGPTSGKWGRITRSFILFDTSAISDTDTLDSAVLSLYGATVITEGDYGNGINIYSSTPASNDDIVVGDFDQVGTSAFATAIPRASFSTSAYNDFTLNATGEAAVDFTGISKFSMRWVNDANNSEPTWESGEGRDLTEAWAADETGTTKDPKLVVEHTAVASATGNFFAVM